MDQNLLNRLAEKMGISSNQLQDDGLISVDVARYDKSRLRMVVRPDTGRQWRVQVRAAANALGYNVDMHEGRLRSI